MNSACPILRIRTHGKPREQRNLDHIRPYHHMGQPDGEGTDIPEIKIRGRIQDTGLQAERSGGKHGVEPDGNIFGQSHVKDDRQDAEQE